MPPYKIPEDILACRQEKRGTWSKPYLYKITPGQKNGKSLIFHMQVGENFYQVDINKVGKTFVYFDCKTLGCKWRSSRPCKQIFRFGLFSPK